MDFLSTKTEFTSAIFKNCIFPNIPLKKGVVKRLPPFKNLSGYTNRFLMGYIASITRH